MIQPGAAIKNFMLVDTLVNNYIYTPVKVNIHYQKVFVLNVWQKFNIYHGLVKEFLKK